MYSSDYSITVKQNGISQNSSIEEKPSTDAPLTARQSVDIFQEAVHTAHDEYEKTAIPNDITGDALQAKLTVDLRRRGLTQLPREVIAIIKQDVERYAIGHGGDGSR